MIRRGTLRTISKNKSLTICRYITKLSQRIQIRSNTRGDVDGRQDDMEFFHKTFPHFIWLLRDVTKTIPPDCKDIKDYFLKKVISYEIFLLSRNATLASKKPQYVVTLKNHFSLFFSFSGFQRRFCRRWL